MMSITFNDAIMNPDGNKWQEAMKSELSNLTDICTWELVKQTEGPKTVKKEWVFDIKQNGSGELVGPKSHLVAKKFSQILGGNIFKAFSSVS